MITVTEARELQKKAPAIVDYESINICIKEAASRGKFSYEMWCYGPEHDTLESDAIRETYQELGFDVLVHTWQEDFNGDGSRHVVISWG